MKPLECQDFANRKENAMQIPTQYRGVWSGNINDTNRKRTYRGFFVLDADGVETTYNMATEQRKGKISLECVSDGFIVLKETVASWSGTLLMYMDSEDNLKCVWRSG